MVLKGVLVLRGVAIRFVLEVGGEGKKHAAGFCTKDRAMRKRNSKAAITSVHMHCSPGSIPVPGMMYSFDIDMV